MREPAGQCGMQLQPGDGFRGSQHDKQCDCPDRDGAGSKHGSGDTEARMGGLAGRMGAGGSVAGLEEETQAHAGAGRPAARGRSVQLLWRRGRHKFRASGHTSGSDARRDLSGCGAGDGGGCFTQRDRDDDCGLRGIEGPDILELQAIHYKEWMRKGRKEHDMTARVSVADVERIAELANLELTPAELGPLSHDLNAILEYVAQLNDLDTTGVTPLAQVGELPGAGGVSVLRQDVRVESLNRDAVMAQAPETDRAFFKVPKVIER